MRFQVLHHPQKQRDVRDLADADACYLVGDNWDDYSYKTSFILIYFDADGVRHEIGATKIMRFGMTSGYTDIDDDFVRLGADYASIGQSQEFYETLDDLEENVRVEILEALRDSVWNNEIFQSFEEEAPFQTSLMRSITSRELKKLREIAHRQAVLTPFHFFYEFPNQDNARIEVEVTPRDVPPSNIHVIIGRNGVGKTSLLRSVSKLLCEGRRRGLGKITFISDDEETSGEEGFSNVVAVAFSAFDEFEPPRASEGTKTGIDYAYIGLRKRVRLKDGSREWRNKTPADLRNDFVQSTLTCLRSSRVPRWREAMRVLEHDPGFATLQLIELAEAEDLETKAGELFDASSSGHKIVLLTMTRLVELVGERSLVLIDEPEAHLHPPLVASFVQALSNLLSSRNGVALLATHSPVVVQEVPRNCVSLFFRAGDIVEISRPQGETFAENVGRLTSEIFRVELTETGYHALITEAVARSNSLEEAIEVFRGRLGAEGRSLVRALWRERD